MPNGLAYADIHAGAESGSFLRKVQASVRSQGSAGPAPARRPPPEPSVREPRPASPVLVVAALAALMSAVVGWALWPTAETGSRAGSGAASVKDPSAETAGSPTPVEGLSGPAPAESAEAPPPLPLVMLPPSASPASAPAPLPPVAAIAPLRPAPVTAPTLASMAKELGQETAERQKPRTVAPQEPRSRGASKPAAKPKVAASAGKAKKKVRRRAKRQPVPYTRIPPTKPAPAPFWRGRQGGYFLSPD